MNDFQMDWCYMLATNSSSDREDLLRVKHQLRRSLTINPAHISVLHD